jgi:hypothetical protein
MFFNHISILNMHIEKDFVCNICLRNYYDEEKKRNNGPVATKMVLEAAFLTDTTPP